MANDDKLQTTNLHKFTFFTIWDFKVYHDVRLEVQNKTVKARKLIKMIQSLSSVSDSIQLGQYRARVNGEMVFDICYAQCFSDAYGKQYSGIAECAKFIHVIPDDEDLIIPDNHTPWILVAKDNFDCLT